MAGPVVLDATQLLRLAEDIAFTAKTIPAGIHPIMAKAGLQMKTKGKAEAAGHKSAPRLPAMWSYDIKESWDRTVVEAGPRTGPKDTAFGPGGVAFYYFGNSKIGASIADPVHILDEEAEVTAEVLATVATKALRLLG